MEGRMKKDNLEVLLEDISGKFSLVLEGHDALHSLGELDGPNAGSHKK